MRLRIKTWLPALAGLTALFATAGTAAAQCNTGCQPPTPPTGGCCQPPTPPPTPPGGGCCQPPGPPPYPGGGGGGGGGGYNYNNNVNVNVNINGNINGNGNYNNNGNNNGNSNFNAHTTGLYGGGGGGGGAYFSVEQPYPTVIQGLSVEAAAAAQIIQVPFQASRWSASRVVIQAFCIDDRDIPHPASQVMPGRDVTEGYEGELFRCIAGTRLQYTWADFLDQVSFENGQTMSCQKGESLWYSAGASAAAAQYAGQYAQAMGGDGSAGAPVGGGVIECRPQRPERDCNERSLLRRYGAGVKVLTMWREETYTEYQEQTVQAQSAVVTGMSLTLDGGVGGRVF